MTNWRMLAAVQTRLTSFTYGYAQVSSIFPTLVVTPAYLVGAIPLGVLMQAAAAFQKVETSCAYFINYYSRIAEWKAALDRLWQLETALQRVETTAPAHGAIEVSMSRARMSRWKVSCCEARAASGSPAFRI